MKTLANSFESIVFIYIFLRYKTIQQNAIMSETQSYSFSIEIFFVDPMLKLQFQTFDLQIFPLSEFNRQTMQTFKTFLVCLFNTAF